MKSRMMYLPLFCLLAASCLFSAPAGAQNGSGWQVMKADWGAGNRWMDVTNQVRRLLNGNGRVLVNNDTMGGDPARLGALIRPHAHSGPRILAARLSNSPTGKAIRLMPASSTTMGRRGIPDIDHHRVPVVPVMATTALPANHTRVLWLKQSDQRRNPNGS